MYKILYNKLRPANCRNFFNFNTFNTLSHPEHQAMFVYVKQNISWF